MAEVRAALAKGISFLCREQKKDGRFVDFQSPSGCLDWWVTGTVTVALAEAAGAAPLPEAAAALQRAADALVRMLRPAAWPYGASAGWDGTSVAVAVRAVVQAGMDLPVPAEDLLSPYIASDGHGQIQRYGRCTVPAEVADVTAVIGLALHAAGADPALRRRVLAAGGAIRGQSGQWPSRWWRQPCYTNWLNLEWLNAEGVLTPSVARATLAAMRRLSGTLSVLDVAALLGLTAEASQAGAGPVPAWVVPRLLLCQLASGAWPSSPSLLLPSPRITASWPEPHADGRRLFTTAMALRALARWHLAATAGRPAAPAPEEAEG